jgi:hypothetical protein
VRADAIEARRARLREKMAARERAAGDEAEIADE